MSETPTVLTLDSIFKKTREAGIVGRKVEIEAITLSILAQRHVLLEGPVGVGKTALSLAVSLALGRKVVRIDGDSRYTESKLVGNFDPSRVTKEGFTKENFQPGPLTEAMQSGSILLINELNRMPESVQNILLPALDEKLIQIPSFGEVRAEKEFVLIATQNPREFVGTSLLGEALQDRLEWIHLGYLSEEEEIEVLLSRMTNPNAKNWIPKIVALIRATRDHSQIKRGASIRAAISLLELIESKLKLQSEITEEDFWKLAEMALPTRVELLQNAASGEALMRVMKTILHHIREVLKKKP